MTTKKNQTLPGSFYSQRSRKALNSSRDFGRCYEISRRIGNYTEQSNQGSANAQSHIYS